MTKSTKNVVLSAAKIVNRKIGKGFKVKIQFVGDRFIYNDIDHKLEIGLQDTLQTEVSYDSLAELELYSQFDEQTAPIGRTGREFIAAELCRSLAWLNCAVYTESSRDALGGVCWDGEHLVATDGRRMHVVRIGQCQVENQSSYATWNVIPSRSVAAIVALTKLFGDDILAVRLDRDCIIVHGECWRFTARLVEGRFPNWRQVVSEDSFKIQLETLQTEKIRESAEFQLRTNKLQESITKKSLSRSELKNYRAELPKLTIQECTYNAEYIRDAIEIIDNAAFVAYRNDNNSPIVIGDRYCLNADSTVSPSIFAVIMPMK